jgi:hypothetical protein
MLNKCEDVNRLGERRKALCSGARSLLKTHRRILPTGHTLLIINIARATNKAGGRPIEGLLQFA